MVLADYFRQGLLTQMGRASSVGQMDILIKSRDLYRALGGYPGCTDGMPSCCDARQDEMKTGDVVLLERTGAGFMTVRYLLPR
jgi:hypothetical protein